MNPPTHTPKVSMLQSAVKDIRSECLRWDTVETGTALVGAQMPEGYLITKAFLPGKRAIRTPGSFSPDIEAVQAELSSYRADHPGEDFLGIHHQHPSWLPRPSGGDLHQAREILQDPSYRINGRLLSIISIRQSGNVHLHPFHITVDDQEFRPLKMEIINDEDPVVASALSRSLFLTSRKRPQTSEVSIWVNPDFQWHQTPVGKARLEEDIRSIHQETGFIPKTIKTSDGVLIIRIKKLLIVFPKEYPFTSPRFFCERRGGKLEEMLVLPHLISWNSSRSVSDLLSYQPYKRHTRDSLVRRLFITPATGAAKRIAQAIISHNPRNNNQTESMEDTSHDQQSQHKRERHRENQNE